MSTECLSDEKMTENFFLGCLPPVDNALGIWSEKAILPPEGLSISQCDYIIMTGITEQMAKQYLDSVHQKATELTAQFRIAYPHQDVVVMIKPILLFDTFEAAMDCRTLVHELAYDEAMELVTEVLLDHFTEEDTLRAVSDTYWYQIAEEYACV